MHSPISSADDLERRSFVHDREGGESPVGHARLPPIGHSRLSLNGPTSHIWRERAVWATLVLMLLIAMLRNAGAPSSHDCPPAPVVPPAEPPTAHPVFPSAQPEVPAILAVGSCPPHPPERICPKPTVCPPAPACPPVVAPSAQTKCAPVPCTPTMESAQSSSAAVSLPSFAPDDPLPDPPVAAGRFLLVMWTGMESNLWMQANHAVMLALITNRRLVLLPYRGLQLHETLWDGEQMLRMLRERHATLQMPSLPGNLPPILSWDEYTSHVLHWPTAASPSPAPPCLSLRRIHCVADVRSVSQSQVCEYLTQFHCGPGGQSRLTHAEQYPFTYDAKTTHFIAPAAPRDAEKMLLNSTEPLLVIEGHLLMRGDSIEQAIRGQLHRRVAQIRDRAKRDSSAPRVNETMVDRAVAPFTIQLHPKVYQRAERILNWIKWGDAAVPGCVQAQQALRQQAAPSTSFGAAVSTFASFPQQLSLPAPPHVLSTHIRLGNRATVTGNLTLRLDRVEKRLRELGWKAKETRIFVATDTEDPEQLELIRARLPGAVLRPPAGLLLDELTGAPLPGAIVDLLDKAVCVVAEEYLVNSLSSTFTASIAKLREERKKETL